MTGLKCADAKRGSRASASLTTKGLRHGWPASLAVSRLWRCQYEALHPTGAAPYRTKTPPGRRHSCPSFTFSVGHAWVPRMPVLCDSGTERRPCRRVRACRDFHLHIYIVHLWFIEMAVAWLFNASEFYCPSQFRCICPATNRWQGFLSSAAFDCYCWASKLALWMQAHRK